jgi:hypothetical protein
MLYYGIKCATIKNAGMQPYQQGGPGHHIHNLFAMKKLLRPGLLIFSGICLLVSCSKERSVETGSGGTPATGGLVKDAQNNCLPVTINGTYDAGIAVTDANYVEMTVTITKPGTYYISTDQQNGLSFADSGYFNVIGAHTLKLGAIGTPILPITTDFTVLFDTSACAFSINVADGTGSLDPNKADSAWSFADPTRSFGGVVDTAYFSTGSNGVHSLSINGYVKNNPDSSFGLALALPVARTIAAGNTFSSVAGEVDFVLTKFTAPSSFVDIYSASFATPTANLAVTITSYNNTTRVIIGTFSGTALATNGTITPISNGKFKARISTL